MRLPSQEKPFVGNFRPRNAHKLMQQMSQPTGPMRPMHPRLPWFVEVAGAYHAPVTLADVLGALFARTFGTRSWGHAIARSWRAP